MRVSLFVTCIVDYLFPQVGVAVVKTLQKLGVEVGFPMEQTCCGQPAFNYGYRDEARRVARHCLRALEKSECVVCPSGSCTAMIRHHYSELFENEPEFLKKSQEIAFRTFEFTEFLTRVMKTSSLREVTRTAVEKKEKVCYHDSCHLSRELGIREEPRALLRRLPGIEVVEMEKADECCGFGGLFSAYLPEVAGAIADGKIDSILKCSASSVVACDMGCLMHLQGRIARRKLPIQCLHIAEVLTKWMVE